MSMYFKKHGKPEIRTYSEHGRTKQSQKDDTDINKLLERAGREGTLSHLEKYQGTYGNFAGYDFETQARIMAEGQTIFEELPAELKREFHQSPQAFFEYVTDPANADDLPKKLPQLADRGRQLPPVGQIQTRQASPPAEHGAAGDGAVGAQATAGSENPSSPDSDVGAPLDTPTG